MKTFNFYANWVDFGEYQGETLDQAKDNFASDAGYKNWDDMTNRADEYGGNFMEIMEIEEAQK